MVKRQTFYKPETRMERWRRLMQDRLLMLQTQLAMMETMHLQCQANPMVTIQFGETEESEEEPNPSMQ